MGLLTAIYLGVGQTLSVIRNAVNPLDYGASGAAMGAVWKAYSMGPRGMVAGGLVGGALGLTGGACFWLGQWASGETVAERWEREYGLMKQRGEAMAARERASKEELLEGSKGRLADLEKPFEWTPFSWAQEKVRNWWRGRVGLPKNPED